MSGIRIPLAVLACLSVIGMGYLACHRPPDVTNVLIITLDTLRYDVLGCYGDARAYTPNMDRLSRSGWLFTRAYCSIPTTLPSHASLFTGMHPDRHGLRANAGYAMTCPPSVSLVPYFAERGYSTAAFCSMEGLASGSGIGRGFSDVYDTGFRWHRVGSDTTEEALKWFSANGKSPFFAWVHLFDAHTPYTPPEPYGRFAIDENPGRYRVNLDAGIVPATARLNAGGNLSAYRAEYAGEVAFLDTQIGRIARQLMDLQIMENTILILTSDHGECFGEQDLFFDHSWRLSEAAVRVPLIYIEPGPARSGLLKPDLAALVDIVPTLARRFGIDLPDQTDGISLDISREPDRSKHSPVFMEIGPNSIDPKRRLRAVTDGVTKYSVVPEDTCYWWQSSDAASVDLETDPMELHPRPVLPGEDDKQFLLGLLKERMAVDTAPHSVENVSSERREMLQALGYLVAQPDSTGPQFDGQNSKIVSAPGVISPQDGYSSRYPPNFRWERLAAAERYRVYIQTVSSAQWSEIDTPGTDLDDLVTLAHWSLLPPGLYEFRVAGLDAQNLPGPASEPIRFQRISAPIYNQDNTCIRIEAETLPSNTGSRVNSENYSAGMAVLAEPDHTPGYMVFGPYWLLPAGDYDVHYKLRFRSDASDPVGWLDVVDRRGERMLAERPIPVHRERAGVYSDWQILNETLRIEHDGNGRLEFRVYFTGRGYLEVDWIQVERRDLRLKQQDLLRPVGDR